MYFDEDRSVSIPYFVTKNVVSVILGGFYYNKGTSRVITVVHIYLLILFFALPITFTFVLEESIYVYVFFPLGVLFFVGIVKLLVFLFHRFFDKNERGVAREVFSLCVPKNLSFDPENRKNEENVKEEKYGEVHSDTGQVAPSSVSQNPPVLSQQEEIVIDFSGNENVGEIIDVRTELEKKVEENLLNSTESMNESDPRKEEEEGGETVGTNKEKEDKEENIESDLDNSEKVGEIKNSVGNFEENMIDGEEEDFNDVSVEEALPMESCYFQDENGVIYEYKMLPRERYEGEDSSTMNPEGIDPSQLRVVNPTELENINYGSSLQMNGMNDLVENFPQYYEEELVEDGVSDADASGDDNEEEEEEDSSSANSFLNASNASTTSTIRRRKSKKKSGWIEEETVDESQLFQYSIFGQKIPLYFDRRFLEILFDKNISIFEVLFSLFLAVSLSVFEIHILYRQEYLLSKLVVAAVGTTCFFSLFKSPQPDSNAFLHYSTLFSFTRPFFFVFFGIIYTIFIEVDYYVLPFSSCYKEIPCFVIMFFPLIFLFGVLPNYQTFVFWVIETFHVTFCGGTGVVDFYGAFFFLFWDWTAILILFGIHYFIPHHSEGFEGIHYLRDFLFAAFLNGIGYFSSRITNDYIGVRKILNLSKLGRILMDIVLAMVCAFVGTVCMIIPFPPLFYVGSVTFVIGFFQYFVLKQFKSFHPFYVLKNPCFCMQYSQFRIILKIFQFLVSTLEVGLYIFIITGCLSINTQIVAEDYGVIRNWHNSFFLSIMSYKLVFMIHTPSLRRCYKILIFSVLYYYFEGEEKLSFIFIMYVYSLVVEKGEELIAKLRYVLVFRNPKSFSRVYHVLFYPVWFPHCTFFMFLMLWSTVASAPLIPWLGSNFWVISYPRPVKFWERKYKTKRKDLDTMSFSQSLTLGHGSSTFANNLNSIFYEHLCKILKRNCQMIVDVIGDHLSTGDFFLVMSKEETANTPDLTALIHFVEVGDSFLTFQLRGLEFDGTLCQSKEQDALVKAVDSKKDSGLYGTNVIRKFKDIRKITNYSWKVISNHLKLKTYKRIEVRAKNMLVGIHGRRLVLKYYPYCIIYFVLTSKKLDNWISPSRSRVFESAGIDKIGEEYVDKDPSFSELNSDELSGIVDPDFDAFRGGISFQLFLKHFGGFINLCLKDFRKRNRRKKRRLLFRNKLKRRFSRMNKNKEDLIVISSSSVNNIEKTRKEEEEEEEEVDEVENLSDFEDPFDEQSSSSSSSPSASSSSTEILENRVEEPTDCTGEEIQIKSWNKEFDEIELIAIKLVYKLTVCARKSLYSEPGFIYGLYENPRQYIETIFGNVSMEINVMDDLWVFEEEIFLKTFSKSLLLSLRLFRDSFVNKPYVGEEEDPDEEDMNDSTHTDEKNESNEDLEIVSIESEKKPSNSSSRIERPNNFLELFQVVKEYDQTITMCTENDPEWRKSIVRKEKESLFTLRRIVDLNSQIIPAEGGIKFFFLELRKDDQNFSIIKVNKFSIRGLWASQSHELIFLENQNRERGSIQQFKYGLRNIISSSADVPVGYPAFISPHVTGYYIGCANFISNVMKLIKFEKTVSYGVSGISNLTQSLGFVNNSKNIQENSSYENLENIEKSNYADEGISSKDILEDGKKKEEEDKIKIEEI